MQKFINPFTDWGFKRLFGQEFSKEKWIYVLKHMEALERMPFTAQKKIF